MVMVTVPRLVSGWLVLMKTMIIGQLMMCPGFWKVMVVIAVDHGISTF